MHGWAQLNSPLRGEDPVHPTWRGPEGSWGNMPSRQSWQAPSQLAMNPFSCSEDATLSVTF